MVKNHLKRITTPTTWPITKRETVFVVRPQTGAHSMETSMPISLVLKDLLGLARTMRGVKFLLNNQEVLVNGARIRRPEATVGLMDIISFPATKTSHRILIDRHDTLYALPVAGDEAQLVPLKVTKKTPLVGGKLQIGFHNGWTIRVDKTDLKVGSTALVTFDKKIKQQFPLAKGAVVLITGGKHVGIVGTLESLENGKAMVKAVDTTVETVQRHLFVIGDKKAAIKITRE